MTDPFANDDPWKDLARDLGVEDATQPAARPQRPAADDPAAEPVGEERPARGFAHRPLEEEAAAEDLPPPDVEAEGFADAVDLDAEDGDDGEAAEGEGGEESPPGEGQPGTGRKRRRRRRRRKKGGAEAGAEGAPADAEAAGEPAGDFAATARATADGFADDAEGEFDEEAEEVGAEAASLAAEEDTGSDVLRDLIATWNVPSWDDIVGGLYRPER